MCVYMYVCVGICECVHRYPVKPEEDTGSPGSGIKMFVNCPPMALGTKLRSSTRAAKLSLAAELFLQPRFCIFLISDRNVFKQAHGDRPTVPGKALVIFSIVGGKKNYHSFICQKLD